MKFRDWFILIFTFVVGVMSGMYVFFTTFEPIYEKDQGGIEQKQSSDITISGSIYGGRIPNGYIQPSFILQADGSYEYFPGGSVDTKKQQGILPKAILENVFSEIKNTDLNLLTIFAPDKECVSYVDGSEHAYTINEQTKTYNLDTCRTTFEENSQLGTALQSVWSYLASPATYIPPASSQSTEDAKVESPDGKSKYSSLGAYFENGFKKAGF